MAPRKRSAKNDDLPENLYDNGGYFRYKHPRTGKFVNMDSDRAAAIKAAKQLNARLIQPANLVMRVLGDDRYTWGDLVSSFIEKKQAKEAKKASTTREENYRLQHISTALGHIALIDSTQRLLTEWLEDNYSGNPYTKHRGTLIKLMSYGIARGMFPDGFKNLAAATLPEREAPKVRKVMTYEQFMVIREHADQWLRVAMDFAIVTLQRLGDIAEARYSDIKNNELYIIQNKTEKHGDRACLRIAIGDSLSDIINRSREVPPLCPFIVHRIPQRKKEFAGQEHWAQLRGATISKAFNRARDASGLFINYGPGEAPTFHEIRGLGGAQYLAQGYSKEYVNLLMGHTTQRMTDSYTEQHINWTECAADLRIG